MRNVFLTLGIILGFISCDSNRVYDQYQSLDAMEWHKDSIVRFQFEVYDSVEPHNLYINLRNTDEFEFNNIFLITKLQYPENRVVIDTLEYEMTDVQGNWLGAGLTDIKENKLFYRENFVFPNTGIYEMFIEQAMRKRNQVDGIKKLNGVSDVGFRIETAR